MSDESPSIQRWTAKRKSVVVLEIIKGKTTAVEVARTHGLTVSEVEAWQERFLRGAEEQLRSNPRDVQAQHDAERRDLLAKVGELTLAVDALKKTNRSYNRGLDPESAP